MLVHHLAQLAARTALAAFPQLAPTLPPAPEIVPFDRLVERADHYLGQEVRAYVQVHSKLETWDGGLTRFVPARFDGIRVWSDEQLPWLQADFVDPAGTLFLRQDSPERRDLKAARPHDRLLVTCVVRELFGGHAWIEVTKILPSRHRIPEGSVLHAIRAAELVERQAWGLAANELERALAAPLPARAAEVLAGGLQACRDKRAAIEAGRRFRRGDAREASAEVARTLRGGRE